MSVKLSPLFNDQTFDASGNPAVGYKLFTYAAGSSTKQTTYTDSTGATPQTNPIILNASGYPTNGPIWLTAGQTYKFVLALSTDTDPPSSPVKTIDGITGVNDTSTAVSQWTSSGVTPTYISSTSFSLAGDQTTDFHVGRRIKATTSGGTVYGVITVSAYAALTTVTVILDSGALDSGLSVVNLGVLRNDHLAIPAGVASAVQAQTATAFTTGGTATAFTLTPVPAITANAANQKFRVKFNAAAGATPTLAISGQTALNLKYYDSTGAKQAITSTQVPINWISDVENDGTDLVVLQPVPASSRQIQPISASVAASALTISASALSLDFRSATLTSGTVTTVSGTPANLVISSGSTLGTTSAVQSRIAVLAINNAGTIELAAVNISGGNDLTETGVISTTAEGGAGAADSASVIYSTTARTNVAYRVIGYVESTQATAGTWATAPSTIQGAGGQVRITGNSMIRLNTSNGYGSTNTVIRRFTNTVTNQGPDITYADSATLGASFTVNTSGVYAISYTDNAGGTPWFGLSINSAQLTTGIDSIATADRLFAAFISTASAPVAGAWTGYLNAGTVLRAHTTGVAGGSAALTTFTITRVA